MTKTVLLTGANGFIGTQIARQLLQNDDVTVLALVRTDSAENGARKLSRDWWGWPELVAALGDRVDVVCGDVASLDEKLTTSRGE
jgi:long-chain acyl-CoA synthetase